MIQSRYRFVTGPGTAHEVFSRRKFHRETQTMRQHRVTISQVAQEAGVSKQTVSRVLNNRPDVAEDTRRRVLQVVEALGYRPSPIARSLSRGESHTIGVVGYGLEYFGPSHVLSGIEKEANRLGYTPLLNLIRQPERNDVVAIIDDLLARQVDGIIWAVPEIGDNYAWVESIQPRLQVPLIFLSARPRPGLLVINVDNRLGGRMATEHLLTRGYRHIGVITGPIAWWNAEERRLGWQDALEAAGVPVDPRLIVEGDWTAASGERALHRLLDLNPKLDAIFACNDQMALGVIRAAYTLGLRIPDDLALVGFDDIPEAAYFCPSLTTVHQEVIELGRLAVTECVRLLQEELHGGDNGTHTLVLTPWLVERESSAK